MAQRRGNTLSLRVSETELVSLARIHRYLARRRYPSIPTQTDALVYALAQTAKAIERWSLRRKLAHGKTETS